MGRRRVESSDRVTESDAQALVDRRREAFDAP